MTFFPHLLAVTPALSVRQWPRDLWDEALHSFAHGPALSWVSVRASGSHDLATVLPWEPVLSLRYDREADRLDVATPGSMHRIARPLALFTLGDGPDVHRVVVVRFDGGLDLLDVVTSNPAVLASGDGAASTALPHPVIP